MAAKKQTPVMRQFEEAKAEHPDAVLFFRLGDFYEMFKDDAVIVSRELGLTLTSRNKGAMDEVPMAGVPHHAAHGYIAKLLAKGYKVAICEQMADPSKVKGIVPRQVVRVVTPGLVTDADQLDEKANHFLAGIAAQDGQAEAYGLALFDLSTGELTTATFDDSATLLAELSRSEPRELLLGEGASATLGAALDVVAPHAVRRLDEPIAERDVATVVAHAVDIPAATPSTRRSKREPPSAESLVDRVRELPRVAQLAVARTLRYARRCTPQGPLPVARLGVIDPSRCLRLDETTQRHLELVRTTDGEREGSLLSVMDATVSAPGARLLRRRLLSPLIDVAAVRRRQDAVEALVVHARARSELRQALSDVTDLERLATRVSLGEATPRDLGRIRTGLLAAPAAVAAVVGIPDASAREALGGDVDPLTDLGRRLDDALVDRPPALAREGGLFRTGFDKELDRLRTLKTSGTESIVALEAKLKADTGAPIKVKYTRVFGWYVEVSRSNLNKVPKSWRRKQTVAAGERYTLEELDQLAADVETADERALEREQDLFADLVAETKAVVGPLRELAARLAQWDVTSALADVAHRFDYVRPEIDESELLEIEGGRHPVVERFAAAGRFVPNDTRLSIDEERLWLVTGPNMAGKSTLMRQVALIVVLAQLGSYVPASRARIGIVDRVLSRVGASDNLARGESTFMVEMKETAAILHGATRRSLVILDEIGRGTSTYDGLAIAWAVAEHLHDVIGCRAMFATHYHELTELGESASGVANVSVSAREHGEDIVFLHALTRGPASRSYGVAVARLAGVPETVLARAKALLADLERNARDAPAEPALAASRGRRSQKPRNQLALFDVPSDAEGAVRQGDRAALDMLRGTDINRLTPIDALTLLAKLQALVHER